ncbi:transcriptional regulator TACO1-like protein [Pelagophyceae sp. CCMP2097]|nr:transcriptional regulator TACO1-like protein [Pelagophyceae sp. CCMP2097]|mmetsp:Transcript_27946/g.94088  ORF Transcript_27946/g.94088 Transcript_27946/m.94088 type:complete len:289 (-) Transcript_27946:60-926(-)
MGLVLLLALVSPAAGYVAPAGLSPRCARRRGVVLQGRKFENNKVKMAKSAASYTKKASLIGKKIQVAVRAGGPDPDSNRALGLVMKEASAMNVKREIVDRNIKSASEKTDGDGFKELTYELYGFGGVGFIINALSDNNNRAYGDIGTAAKKSGLKLAESGSVLHNFVKRGRLTVNAPLTEDEAIELALEADVDDVEVLEPDPDMREDGDEVKSVVLVGPGDLATMQLALQGAGYECVGNLVYEPIAGTLVSCNDEDLERNLAILDKLADVDDVDSVEHNILFTSEDEP